MLMALDLTAAQAARVLNQAVRTRAQLEIEPRPETLNRILWGRVDGRDEQVLRVDLHERDLPFPLSALVGSFCDIRSVLSGDLYLFSSCVIDAIEATAPQRLLLSLPTAIQLVNRRKQARRVPIAPMAVTITAHQDMELRGEVANLSSLGVACRVARAAADEALLLGDEVRVQFEFTWLSESFELPALVCGKSGTVEPQQMLLGLEFVTTGESGAQPALQRLAWLLAGETTHLQEADGDQ